MQSSSSNVPTCSRTRATEDSDFFKNIPIFPNKDDLLSPRKYKLEPNIINGAYRNIEHYLDLQFKLLREDCFAPLREGICQYLSDKTKRKYGNIRIYPEVHIVKTCVVNNKVGYMIDLLWNERKTEPFDSNKYNISKQLMFGSLLLFTNNSFNTIICATVLDSSLLSDGFIVVTFEMPISKNMLQENYLMVESEVFFEPYRRVMEVLKNNFEDDIPMSSYIVKCQAETKPPGYLTKETVYSMLEADRVADISFPVLDVEKWPLTVSFGLDGSQMEAYIHALTKEFAVIQGPPGTGKTFLGIKIASTMLYNMSLEGTPLLIICYTNNALDQFLEGLIDVTSSIVRIGSQSKSKLLEPLNLNNVRSNIKSKYSSAFATRTKELESLVKAMSDLQSDIDVCNEEILKYKTIRASLKIGRDYYELKSSKEDPVLTWLFGLVDGQPQPNSDEEVDFWEDTVQDEDLLEETIESCFSEKKAEKDIKSYYLKINNAKAKSSLVARLEGELNKLKKRLEVFKSYKHLAESKIELEELSRTKVKNVYSLTTEQRFKVYYLAAQAIKGTLLNQATDLAEKYKACNTEVEELSTMIDGEAMKTARVVGVTTTTAARRHDLMRKLLSPIVIVEEAAEVMESHIVASLTFRCQHLILIGDHKQLRPTAAHYRIGKEYNLEVSLFERMIRNGIHSKTLTIQRRMRPIFSELLVPTIYEKLESHPSVTNYPDVKGMAKNLFFFNHEAMEVGEDNNDIQSHQNELEAKWCVTLAAYLRQVGYKAEDIVILATYAAQVDMIKKLSEEQEQLKEVKITAVDGYQGQESKIVILTLVRSNTRGRIGFLADENRICVALSRAREGFYIFGNMNFLATASPIWLEIHQKLTSLQAIGDKLPLACPNHSGSLSEVNDVNEFKTILSGSCLKDCKSKE